MPWIKLCSSFHIFTFVLTRWKSYILHLDFRRIPRTVLSLSSYRIVLTAVGKREVRIVRFDFVYRSFLLLLLLLTSSPNFLFFPLNGILSFFLFLPHSPPPSPPYKSHIPRRPHHSTKPFGRYGCSVVFTNFISFLWDIKSSRSRRRQRRESQIPRRKDKKEWEGEGNWNRREKNKDPSHVARWSAIRPFKFAGVFVLEMAETWSGKCPEGGQNLLRFIKKHLGSITIFKVGTVLLTETQSFVFRLKTRI